MKVSKIKKKSKILMISAWRYPGISKPGSQIPIPEDIFKEIKGFFKIDEKQKIALQYKSCGKAESMQSTSGDGSPLNRNSCFLRIADYALRSGRRWAPSLIRSRRQATPSVSEKSIFVRICPRVRILPQRQTITESV